MYGDWWMCSDWCCDPVTLYAVRDWSGTNWVIDGNRMDDDMRSDPNVSVHCLRDRIHNDHHHS